MRVCGRVEIQWAVNLTIPYILEARLENYITEILC